MKKEIKKQNTEFSIQKINRIISKINKTGLILIVVCYIGLLSCLLSMVGKEISYVSEPNYEHQFYNKEISPQITIVGVRDFSEGSSQPNTKYSVSVNIAGRHIDSKDPNYKINSFRMFANTKKELTDTKLSSTHYFTEHTTYTTPITHSFTMDGASNAINPSTFYVRLQYDGNKVETFKEEVFLQPTEIEKDKLENWYQNNLETSPSAANILCSADKPVGVIEVQSYVDKDENGKSTGKYLAGVRLTVNDDITDNFHIDMQSWIVTANEEYLPFIGVYNYTGSSKRFTNSGKNIDMKLEPEYIAVKVVYKDKTNNEEHVSYFKQDITKIKGTFSTNQEVGKDVDAGLGIDNNRVVYTVLVVASAFALAVVVFSCSYVYVKKQEKNNLKK